MTRIVTSLALLLLCCAVVSAQRSKVDWFAFDMGFAVQATGNTVLKSVAGQPFVGTTAVLSTQVLNGFLVDTLLRKSVLEIPGTQELPGAFTLLQNFPNPFNPSTTIRYELPKSSEVRLSVYDMLGREVSVLVNEKRDAGVHEVRFDASGLASGVYLYRLTAGSFVETRKLVLVR